MDLKYLTYDVETVPNDRAEAYVAKFEEKVVPNKKLSDPEKIEANIVMKKKQLRYKLSLQWWTAQIVSISVKADGYVMNYFSHDEETLLANFFTDLIKVHPDYQVFGFNSNNFDIGMVRGRAISLNMGLPIHFRKTYKPISDIYEIFGMSSQSSHRGTLEQYAWGVGIDIGDDIRGSQVGDCFNEYLLAPLQDKSKFKDKIINHNNLDVEINWEIFSRFRKPFEPEVYEAITNIPF